MPEILTEITTQLERRIAGDMLDVPMLPEVASKVVRLTQSPDSEAADLAKLIQSDPVLAGKVMRTANSALYSPNNSMVSLQQAITRLGMRLIAEIALSASINTCLFNTPGFERHIACHMKHSVAAGLWAKEVARACRKNVEAAFLAGLLHDIGRPVAVQSILEICRQLDYTISRDDVLASENHYQQRIGMRVVEKWEMPESVCHSVKFFHNYKTQHHAQPQTMLVVAGALIASHFVCEEGDNTRCITTEELKDHEVFADLNLYPDNINDILEKEEWVNQTLKTMSA